MLAIRLLLCTMVSMPLASTGTIGASFFNILIAKTPVQHFVNYRIGGIFRGEKILAISRFRKNYTQKTKILYGSHLIFDQFAKF